MSTKYDEFIKDLRKKFIGPKRELVTVQEGRVCCGHIEFRYDGEADDYFPVCDTCGESGLTYYFLEEYVECEKCQKDTEHDVWSQYGAVILKRDTPTVDLKCRCCGNKSTRRRY